jgi:hypothetical protein
LAASVLYFPASGPLLTGRIFLDLAAVKHKRLGCVIGDRDFQWRRLRHITHRAKNHERS